jgi:hypothetical protein
LKFILKKMFSFTYKLRAVAENVEVHQNRALFKTFVRILFNDTGEPAQYKLQHFHVVRYDYSQPIFRGTRFNSLT